MLAYKMTNALPIQSAAQSAALASNPGLRIEPCREQTERASLVVAAWIGKKRYCEAQVLERNEDAVTVLAAAPLEEGEQVWFADNDPAGGLFVRTASQEGAGFRMELHKERRRSPRWRVDEQGELEWPEDGKPGRANVLVVDVSAGGLRIRSEEPIPEEGEVRVKFAGMVRDGEIRYCLPMGGATVAGIEFV